MDGDTKGVGRKKTKRGEERTGGGEQRMKECQKKTWKGQSCVLYSSFLQFTVEELLPPDVTVTEADMECFYSRG